MTYITFVVIVKSNSCWAGACQSKLIFFCNTIPMFVVSSEMLSKQYGVLGLQIVVASLFGVPVT